MVRSQRRLRSTQRRRGVATVEFAVILPVLLLLVVGLFELGQLVRVRQILDNAVREGARQASLGKKSVNVPNPLNPSLETIEGVVKNYLLLERINVAGLQVKVTAPGGGGSIDPRTLNGSVNQTTVDRFRIEATLPYDRNGSQGNRLVSLNLKAIRVPKLTSWAEWYSMKDFPIQTDVLGAPIE